MHGRAASSASVADDPKRTLVAAFAAVHGLNPLQDLLCAWLFIYASQASRWASSELKATRGSCRLLVPVKTRNNTTSKGKLKTDPYNLYTRPGHHDAATKIAAFAGAEIFSVGDCRCEGENLFGLHGRCRQTALH
jgi:hypothetical protein